MATFVLVQGAWGGSYGFHLVRPLLRAAGHDVYTPSLTGLGERAHLTGPHINLSTHVRDVVNSVLYEDLTDIVLLGFSYGGMVVTGALEYIADRVSHLVYLDAFLPNDGECVVELSGRVVPAFAIGSAWLMPPADRTYEDASEAEWAAPRRCHQSVGTFTEPVRLLQPLENYPFSRTYIKATGDERVTGPGSQFWDAADRTRSNPAWCYRETTSNHMVPHNRPGELASMLLELV
jgi:pimeloyl-ACP methyl ester carboxylesterase